MLLLSALVSWQINSYSHFLPIVPSVSAVVSPPTDPILGGSPGVRDGSTCGVRPHRLLPCLVTPGRRETGSAVTADNDRVSTCTMHSRSWSERQRYKTQVFPVIITTRVGTFTFFFKRIGQNRTWTKKSRKRIQKEKTRGQLDRKKNFGVWMCRSQNNVLWWKLTWISLFRFHNRP